jgi:hypothetical protein
MNRTRDNLRAKIFYQRLHKGINLNRSLGVLLAGLLLSLIQRVRRLALYDSNLKGNLHVLTKKLFEYNAQPLCVHTFRQRFVRHSQQDGTPFDGYAFGLASELHGHAGQR